MPGEPSAVFDSNGDYSVQYFRDLKCGACLIYGKRIAKRFEGLVSLNLRRVFPSGVKVW